MSLIKRHAQNQSPIHKRVLGGIPTTALTVLLGTVSLQATAATFTVTKLADDSSTGTLRWAIEQANATAGADTIDFKIAGIATGIPAIIHITSAVLPPITEAVTIDGTTQTDTNTGSITGGQVLGVGPDFVPGSGDEATLPILAKPDVVVEYARTGNPGTGIFTIGAPDVTIKGLGVRRGPPASGTVDSADGVHLVAAASNTILSQMWFGSSQGNATDLTDGAGFQLGHAVINGSTAAYTVEQSVLVNLGYFGIRDLAPTHGPLTARQNFFGTTGLFVNWNGEPIALAGTVGTHRIEHNYFSNKDYAGGIDVYGSRVDVLQNTFEANYNYNQDPTASDETGAIVLRSGSVGSRIEGNLIFNSGYANGILVQGSGYDSVSYGVVISRNSIYGNGQFDVARIGIDLNGAGKANADGVTPNDGAFDTNAGNRGIDYPVFTSSALNGNQLTVTGFVGTPASSAPFAGATIEIFTADNAPANQNGAVVVGDGKSVPHGEGRVYLGTLTADGAGLFNGSITIPAAALAAWQAFLGHAPTTGDAITATATLAAVGTSEFGANQPVVAIVGVTESKTVMVGVAAPGALPNVRSNDTINGQPATAANSTIAVVGTWPAGITLNTATGAVDVAATVPVGVYPITYQLCDLATPVPNCTTVQDTITVVGQPTPVPTSGQWGLMLTSLLLAALGITRGCRFKG